MTRAARWAALLVSAPLLAAWAGCADPCCVVDGDCAAGARCFEGVCSPRCVDDGGCASGEVCVRPAGVCAQPLRAGSVCPFDEPDAPPGCEVPDPFEPNDSRAQAGSAPVFAALAICPAGDEDFFRVDLRAGDRLEVELALDGRAGDLDLQLLADNGEVLAESTSVDDRERVTVVAGQDARVFIRVFGFNDEENAYELATTVTPAGECLPDEFEPNDEDPHQIPTPANISATLCPNDVDLYVFETPGNISGRLRITHDHPEGIFASVSRPGGGGAQAETGPGFASLDFNVGAPGELVLGITATPNDRPVSYTFTLELDGPEQCLEDDLEPNDTDADATDLELPANLEASLCDFNEDRYRFFAEEGVTLSLDIVHDDPQGLDVVVRRPGGGSAEGQNRPGRVELQFNSAVTGDLIIDVAPRSSASVRYALSLTEGGGGPGPGGCGDDDQEPNDGLQSATLVDQLFTGIEGEVCGPDQDFFRFTVFSQPTTFLQVQGNGVRFVLFTQDGAFFEDVTTQGNETEVIFPPQADEVFLVVTRQGPPRAYSLFVGAGE